MLTIDEMVANAHSYFAAFGFEDSQIEKLTLRGVTDLTRLLQQLKGQLEAEKPTVKDVDDTLHAIKGVIAQLGNQELTEQLTEIRKNLADDQSMREIYELFF